MSLERCLEVSRGVQKCPETLQVLRGVCHYTEMFISVWKTRSVTYLSFNKWDGQLCEAYQTKKKNIIK